MNHADHDTLHTIYTGLQSQACPASRVGYEDALQQALYFEILTAIGISPTASVLDVGCGHGDLYAYLSTRGYRGRYTGLDMMPHLIKEARQRFHGVEFRVGDITAADLDPCDYALASGPFDYRTPNSLERWQLAIRRMFELARCGIAWNGLVTVPEGYAGLWAQPLPAVLELCAGLSPYYSLRCDYDPPHLSAYVYKREHFYSEELQALIGHLYLHPEYAQALRNDPTGCAAQFGVSLRQLNAAASLWAS
ncbi:MAG: class I SAM-dependent methyltransferase [Thermoflexales bacterium]|nr:class I SAM-dependent methyltransferase [Thermoflexales bacterium]